MAYEIDIIGVGDEVKKDADAIVIHWKSEQNSDKIVIYDGGLQVHGDKMVKHLNEYIFYDSKEKIIDCIICSHSDMDHTVGLKKILEEFKVKKIYMNRPWLYVDEVWDSVNDGRITKESLMRRLKEQYKYIYEIEEIATNKGVEISDAFQGQIIENKLEILSPSKEFYLKLMIESSKTPLEELNDNRSPTQFTKKIIQYVKNLIESWNKEQLRENVETSSENEMSVVVWGDMEEEKFLLTGDAGIRALNEAIAYSNKIGKSIKDNVNFLQIPHHGGRHNVSPSVLDNLIGEVVKEKTTIGKTAFVSVAKHSDHPLQMVVNAFIRRGVKVYKTDGRIMRHSINMPIREGWTSMKKLDFDKNVEEWED